MILALLLAAAPVAAPPTLSADATEVLAQSSSDASAGRLWATAGNMRLATGDAAGAARDFDRALTTRGLSDRDRGEALLDRARAAQAAGDLATASARAADAARLIPQDPFVWYFRSVVAVTREDVPQAKIAIGRALALAPNDSTILFEAGHVAKLAGEDARARDYWAKSSAADPRGKSGDAARAALGLMPVPLTVAGGAISPASNSPTP